MNKITELNNQPALDYLNENMHNILLRAQHNNMTFGELVTMTNNRLNAIKKPIVYEDLLHYLRNSVNNAAVIFNRAKKATKDNKEREAYKALSLIIDYSFNR